MFPALVLAAAIDTAAPISLESCRIAFPMIARSGRQLYEVRVRFINRSDKRVSEVHFAATVDGRAVDVVDAGSFDSNAQVAHRLRDFLGFDVIEPSENAMPCDVSQVRFSDGSIWRP